MSADNTGPAAARRLLNEAQTREQLGGISRSKLYDLIGKGEMMSVRIGTRRLFEQSAIDAFIERNRQTAALS
jgi:excisionase family DNA binding protein